MSEKDQTTPIEQNEAPSSGRRQFMTGVASAIGAGVILNAAGSSVAAQTSTDGREIISFKLSREDLAKIGEVVTRLQVTHTADPSKPGAFTIRNHSFNAASPGAFTIRNHAFDASTPGAYTIRNYQFSAV